MASWNRHEEVRNELLGKGKKEIVYPTYTLQDAYELTDQNNDQQISVKEIGFISERISKHTGDEIFEKYDQDNNKVLDMNELRTYLAHEVERTDNTMSDFLSEFVGQFKNFVAHEHHNENMYQHQKNPPHCLCSIAFASGVINIVIDCFSGISSSVGLFRSVCRSCSLDWIAPPI